VPSVEGRTYSAESDGLLLVIAEQARGVIPTVQLIDVALGVSWGPVPALRLEILDIGCQRIEVHPPSRVEIDRRDDGAIEIAAAHEYFGVGCTVRFAIDRGELVVTIPTDRIVQAHKVVARLAGVGVLPGLMEVEPWNPGHLVLPIQNGALLYPDRHQRLNDGFLIYGQQHRWEDLPLLPCCGAVRERAKAALLAIAASGECDAECKVELDGHGRGSVGFSMRYCYTWIDPVDAIDRVVRIVPLRDEDASYAGMGRRMFRHVGEKSGRPPLKQRAAENPNLAYAATSYTVKIFHAHKQIGPLDGSGEYNVWTTFDEAAAQMSFLKQNGIDKVWVQNVGWQPWGHDGIWPTRWPVNESLGGEEAFRRFIAHGKSLGYQMCVHDNHTEGFPLSPDFKEDQIVGGIHGGPLVRGRWSGGVSYPYWGPALTDKEVRDELLKVKDLGIDGVYYIDDMGIPLEISHNPKHGEHRYRRAFAESFEKRLKTAASLFSGSATEAGFLYVAAHVDSIASTWYPHLLTRQSPLVDRHVPLWCMALKGHLFYESDVLHHYVADAGGAPHQTMTHRLLEMAEVGMKPRTETSYRMASWLTYPVEACIEAMRLDQDLMLRKLSSTLLEPLVDHALVAGDVREGNHVMRSRYGDGTETLCDYGRQRLEINGEPYPLPVNFKKQQPLPVGVAFHSDVGKQKSRKIAPAGADV
jgi:hypothetical protein